MLENMRRQGASIFIYLIFGLLIAIFVVNIGPGSRNEGGCRGTDNSRLVIDGDPVSQTAFAIAFGFQQYLNYQKPPTATQRVEFALEALIAREILADEAESRGMRLTDDAIKKEISTGTFFYRGMRMKPSAMYEVIGGEKYYTRMKQWVAGLNVSTTSYVEEQKRSMLATLMAEILTDSVAVSRDEALQEFLYEGSTAAYDLVPFRIDNYRAALKPTDADFEKFIAAHDADLQARYKADERTYKGVKPQLELREIFIAKAEPPKAEPPKAAGSGAGSAVPEKIDDKKSVGMTTDEAKAKLEAARTAIAGGKQKFDAAARELSTDEALRSTGGRVGWRTADSAGFDEPAINDAIKTLKPGEMTPVITTERGAYLVIAETKREGDLSFDQVKQELGREMAMDTWSKEAAKRAALAALEKARAAGKPLHELYETTPRDPFEGLTPRQQRKMMQQMLQRGGGGDEQGSITIESENIPASWTGDSSTPATGGSATATAGSAAPAAGSAAAGTAPATGTATPAATPDATATPADDAMTPTKDPLPAMGEVPPVKAESHQSARLPDMPGYGRSKEITDAVFEQLAPGELSKRIYQANNAYYLVQAVGRQQPKVEDFDKMADERIAEIREARGEEFLHSWLRDRCEKLAKDGKIKPNRGILQEHDEQGNPLPITYRPCMTF